MQCAAARVLFFLLMVCSLSVRADVIVSVGGGADKEALFLVETRSNHPVIHSTQVKYLDERLIRPGEPARIPVKLVNPITFSYLTALIYHPAYVYESKRVDEMPSVFKTVRIPEFKPRSWRSLIDSDEKVLQAGSGIYVLSVRDHLNTFIRKYLPAIDAAGIKDDLKTYLPLFEELIAYTEKTLPVSSYGNKSIDELRKKDPVYAQKLDRMEQKYLKQTKDAFTEIKALLSLTAARRIQLRAMQKKMVNTRSVYNELMTAQDRQRIGKFMDFQFENARAKPKPDKSQQWTNGDTNVLYSIALGDRYTVKGKEGKRLYDNCYKTSLGVDLHAVVQTDLEGLKKAYQANFCLDDRGEWLIQLTGGK
ncbi:MAG: hypothetical protein BMS9Abin09_1125 [Gammaproteobacteria bacterium]|nr:MAG: hypothetical protein BMS9Abin09_1125 [Gammaproteobacteria bacterium]